MVIVTLTALELRALWQVANERSETKIGAGTVDRIGASERYTSAQFAYIGLKGEYSVCRFLDTPFDMENFTGLDPGFDTEFQGLEVQIKTQQRGLFWLEDNDKMNADVFVKVVGGGGGDDPYVKGKTHSDRDVGLLGWISKEEFLKMSERTKIGKLDVIAIQDTVLRPIWTLMGTT